MGFAALLVLINCRVIVDIFFRIFFLLKQIVFCTMVYGLKWNDWSMAIVALIYT